MIRIFVFFITILLCISSCAFDYDSPAVNSKKKYSRVFSDDFRKNGNGFLKRVKPSESMQAGIPKRIKLNFIASNYSVYNTANSKSYRVKGSKFNDNYNSQNNYERDPNFSTVDDEYAEESSNSEDKNFLSSGVYTGHFKIGQPYTAFGVSYVPQDYESYEEVGTASWYGSDFNGKMTANGEIYNMGDLTAAHPTLPLPSLVKVTNLDNGKSEVLRVNDRGPFAKNRVIDVSEKAAEVLGFKNKGTAEVKVELLREDTDNLLQNLKIAN